jgi:hypothetical protein
MTTVRTCKHELSGRCTSLLCPEVCRLDAEFEVELRSVKYPRKLRQLKHHISAETYLSILHNVR